MGQRLFHTDISGLIAKHVGGGLPFVTLVKLANTARTAGSLTAGQNPVELSFTCRGVMTAQAQRHRTDARPVDDGTREVLLIGDTIANGAVAPALGDHIVIEGATYVIEKIKRDTAFATYGCTVRKR